MSWLANSLLLTKFFEIIGPLARLLVYWSPPSIAKAGTRFCMVEFVQPQHVQAAQQLNGTSLVGSHLSIALATQENIPKIDQSMPVENGLNPTASLGPVPVAPTVLPGSERPPSRFPPLTAEQSDEVSRTVYVGNVNSEASPEAVQALFEVCGKITYCRLAGDATHPSRFAFIEFETQEGAQKAMNLNGRNFMERPLKVNQSKNPIVKTPSATPREEERIQRKLKKAADRITRWIEDYDYERDRDRHGNRSPRRESRSRRDRHDDYYSSRSSRHHRDYDKGYHRSSRDYRERDYYSRSSRSRRERDYDYDYDRDYDRDYDYDRDKYGSHRSRSSRSRRRSRTPDDDYYYSSSHRSSSHKRKRSRSPEEESPPKKHRSRERSVRD